MQARHLIGHWAGAYMQVALLVIGLQGSNASPTTGHKLIPAEPKCI